MWYYLDTRQEYAVNFSMSPHVMYGDPADRIGHVLRQMREGCTLEAEREIEELVKAKEWRAAVTIAGPWEGMPFADVVAYAAKQREPSYLGVSESIIMGFAGARNIRHMPDIDIGSWLDPATRTLRWRRRYFVYEAVTAPKRHMLPRALVLNSIAGPALRLRPVASPSGEHGLGTEDRDTFYLEMF